MNSEEKSLARIIFQNKIYSSDGQIYENLFISIMNYKYSDFQAIKPWGNIGDRKNDGYRKEKGIYYQVFAPEDIKKSYNTVVSKLEKDLKGLLEHWENVNEYHFVINDKYKGVHPDSEIKISSLRSLYNLNDTSIFTSKDLENILFELDPDMILKIVGFLPNPSTLKTINYDILNIIIDHIMNLPLENTFVENLVVPDWNDKIIFNSLSSKTSSILNSAFIHVHSLDDYLKNSGDFLKNTLGEKVRNVYNKFKYEYSGDELFVKIMFELSPANTLAYQNIITIIMAKYFETCDIFEEPKEVYNNDITN